MTEAIIARMAWRAEDAIYLPSQRLFDNMYSCGVADKTAGRGPFPPGQKGSFAYTAYMRGYGPLQDE